MGTKRLHELTQTQSSPLASMRSTSAANSEGRNSNSRRRAAIALNNYSVKLSQRGTMAESMRLLRQARDSFVKAAENVASVASKIDRGEQNRIGVESEPGRLRPIEEELSVAVKTREERREPRSKRSRTQRRDSAQVDDLPRQQAPEDVATSAETVQENRGISPQRQEEQDVGSVAFHGVGPQKQEQQDKERHCKGDGDVFLGLYREETDDHSGIVHFYRPHAIENDDDDNSGDALALLQRGAAIASYNMAVVHNRSAQDSSSSSSAGSPSALELFESALSHLRSIPHEHRTPRDGHLEIEIHNNIARIHVERGRQGLAVAAYLRAFEVKSASGIEGAKEEDDLASKPSPDTPEGAVAAVARHLADLHLASLRRVSSADPSDENEDGYLLRQAVTASNMGQLYFHCSTFAEAVAACRVADALRSSVLGDEHLQVAVCRYNFGLLLHRLGNLRDAKRCYADFLSVAESWDASRSCRTETEDGCVPATKRGVRVAIAAARHQFGLIQSATGDLPGAVRTLLQVLAERRELHGARHSDVAKTLFSLGQVLFELGRVAEASLYFEETLRISRSVLGPTHMILVFTLSYMGQICHRVGEDDVALVLYDEALQVAARAFGETHHVVINLLNLVGNLRVSRREMNAAARCFARASGIYVQSIMSVEDASGEGGAYAVITTRQRVGASAA